MLNALFYPGNVPFDSLFIPAIYHEIYYDSVYLDIMNVLDKEKKDPVIIDIGANIGITVQHFKEHAKKVYALEPASENFEALQKNKEFNHWDNVELFKVAVSHKKGQEEMRIYSKNHTSNSLVLRDTIDKDFETVETTTLNSFLIDNKIEHVDFVKLDIEGSEKIVMMTEDFAEATKKIDNFMVEFHFNDFPEQINRMIELGYKARRYPCGAVVVGFSK
jgi:FkbM family methyltransferase